jgi:type IV pilus assembly protein PilP
MEATARTFRYLDPEEIRAQKAAAKGAKKEAPGCKPLIALLGALLLAGCGGNDEDELRQWMSDQRADDRRASRRSPSPSSSMPQDYTGDGNMDPFNPQKLTQALRRESSETVANVADRARDGRRKEPLEAYPLDTMKMVGSLNKTGVPTALVRVDKLLYQVRWATTWARTTARSSASRKRISVCAKSSRTPRANGWSAGQHWTCKREMR